MEPNKGGQKPETLNPISNALANHPAKDREIAFTTKRNRPRDKIVRGKVRMVIIGLTVALTNPIITTANIAAVKLFTSIPGTIFAVISREIAATNQVKKKFSIYNHLFRLKNDFFKPNFTRHIIWKELGRNS